ncbi:MAG: type I-C CRISPR-associated protein Cas7/Csd2 [Rhodocyclales bacterium]|nr:type I-C CRISPR-associated protein Cas7/Csd2 [Rhodocyclales bacterium]
MSLQHRYDFVWIFDVKDGNPNGDPDAGNLPRIDAETGHGLVTDVALKRKIRNFVAMTHDQNEDTLQPGEKRYEIYVREKAILNLQHQRAYTALGLDRTEDDAESEEGKKGKKKRKGSGDAVELARQWMCQNFFDVRTFGAVMSTGVNCGQVRGPVQLTFARSVDPIVAQEHSITRMAVTTEEEAAKQQGDNRTMGRKHTVPYGLYIAHGFVSAFLADQTGFDEDDLQVLYQAICQSFEHDRSAARGEMATRALIVFEHESKLGNAPAYALFERVQIERKPGVEIARAFTDYDIKINEESLPAGVRILRIC